jgi:CRP-like cAMP-binding protein
MLDVSELANIPFLEGVPEAELEPWAAEAETVTVRRREVLFNPGDPSDEFFLVRSGLIVHCLEAAVGETRMTAIIDPQQCVNICCLHPSVRHTSSGVALTDATLIRLPATIVRDSLERGGKLARILGGYAAAWSAYLADEFIRATTQDVRTRAAVAMIRLMDTLGTSEIPLSQEQIAGLIGTRRETLALTLGEMRRQRILDTRYRRIRVLNRQALLRDARDSYPTCIAHAVPIPITGRSSLQNGTGD